MEYGLLFFLEMVLLYYGFNKGKKWVLTLLPVFIMFTRIDTVIFLGIVFLVDIFCNKKSDGIMFLAEFWVFYQH